jgi:hypothetical protein
MLVDANVTSDCMQTPDNCQHKYHNYYDPSFCANMYVSQVSNSLNE